MHSCAFDASVLPGRVDGQPAGPAIDPSRSNSSRIPEGELAATDEHAERTDFGTSCTPGRHPRLSALRAVFLTRAVTFPKTRHSAPLECWLSSLLGLPTTSPLLIPSGAVCPVAPELRSAGSCETIRGDGCIACAPTPALCLATIGQTASTTCEHSSTGCMHCARNWIANDPRS
jgi:hypothetical protein